MGLLKDLWNVTTRNDLPEEIARKDLSAALHSLGITASGIVAIESDMSQITLTVKARVDDERPFRTMLDEHGDFLYTRHVIPIVPPRRGPLTEVVNYTEESAS